MTLGHLIKDKSKLIRKRFKRRLKIYLKYYFKRSVKNPVFVISTPRSGSNLLLDYLNSIPYVSFASEILHPDMTYGIRKNFISKRAVLRHIRHSLNDCPKRVCGAKIHLEQLQAHGLTLADLKTDFPDAKFIILYRRSLFNQFVSRQIAEMTHHWSWNPDFRLPDRVQIDVVKLQRFSYETKKAYQEIFKNNAFIGDCFMLVYEELAANPQSVFDGNLFKFLGVPLFPISTSMKKQTTKLPAQIITNFEEVEWATHHPAFTQDYSSGTTARELQKIFA